MTKISEIKIRNFKGIAGQKVIKANGSHVYAIGANGKGKTSFIDAVWTTLTGKGLPSQPINDDHKEATVEVDLDNGLRAVVEFKKGRKKTATLSLYDDSGDKPLSSPRTRLDELVGIIDFDVNHFFALTDLEKVKYLSKVLELDFTEIDNDIAEAMEERKMLKREIAPLKADDDGSFLDEELLSKEEIDVADLYEQRAKMQEKVLKVDNFKQKVTDVMLERKQVVSDIEELEQRLIKLKEKQADLNDKFDKGQKWIKDNPVESIKASIKDIDDKLAQADSHNEAIQAEKKKAQTRQQIDQKEKDIEIQQEAINNLREAKRNALMDAIDIEGLDYDGEVFTFDGLPFEREQINTASQIIAGLKIGASLLNKVPILRLDASLLDDDNLDTVKAWADDNDIQLFIELLDRTGSDLIIKVEEE